MYRKFKIKDYNKLSKAKRLLVRKRSTEIALRLKVFHDFLNAKTEEQLDSIVAQMQKEVSSLISLLESRHWNKLPRKRKKKEKRLICDYFNAYALIPELVALVISNGHERKLS